MSYTPIESKEYPGFYIVPECDEVLVNENGSQVIRAVDGVPDENRR